MNQVGDTGKEKSKLTPTLIAGTFIFFILVAIIFYIFDIHPSSTRNYGELVTPARPLPEFNLTTYDEKPFALKDIQRKWSYVYFAESNCDDACKLNLQKMSNAKVAQGTESSRVNYYLILTTRPTKELSRELTETYPRLNILYSSSVEPKGLFDIFEKQEGKSLLESQRVHMIDPIGNYMMYYESSAEGVGFMEDLKFLLKVSQIG
jgi:hypothetical protein